MVCPSQRCLRLHFFLLVYVCDTATAVTGVRQHQLRGDAKSKHESRDSFSIVNGSEVQDPTIYSFYALPTKDNNSNLWLGCGASIISQTWGMMAAHCFGGGNAPCTGPESLALWLGDVHLDGASYVISPKNSSGMHARVEAEVVCHPLWDGHCSHGSDLVLLRLKTQLPNWVKPVRINLNSIGTDSVGELALSMGYGLRELSDNPAIISDVPPSVMRKVNLTVFADSYHACDAVYHGGYGCSDEASEGAATNKMQQFCAGATDSPPRDTCSGDSGSPMLDKFGVQIGIVSYGGGPGSKMSGPGRICADPNYMGIYTRVSAFHDFITEHVQDLNLTGH